MSEDSKIILNPCVIFDLKRWLGVGPMFYQYYLVWKFRLPHWVWNIEFNMVAYIICVHRVPDEYKAPCRSFYVFRKYCKKIYTFLENFLNLLTLSSRNQIRWFRVRELSSFGGFAVECLKVIGSTYFECKFLDKLDC